MGKWGKYNKNFNPKWLKEVVLRNWLEPTSEDDCMNGLPQAYCKLCKCHIRAHHSDLLHHAKTSKHLAKERSMNRQEQSALDDHGYDIVKNENKVADVKLAVYIAMHSTVRSVDHLNDLLKMLGKKSCLEKAKLHRTKCSKIISNVVAPAFLKELIQDVDDSYYALIVDEATDVSVSKFMGVCIRYFSTKHQKMLTDFLSIIPVTSCTGKDLAVALMDYLNKIGLSLKRFNAVGTDGAPNMCGLFNSFYTHLKEHIPDLTLLKCVCHSIDKCAQYAFKKMPDELNYILSESHNYFAHSAKRWGEYVEHFKGLNQGKIPEKLPALATTRWLVWVPVSKQILNQWPSLRSFFIKKGQARDYKAQVLAQQFNNCNLLYITFLKTVLEQVSEVNFAFERADADLAQLYTDLRSLVFTLARRILKPQAIAETSRPGILRSEEVLVLNRSLSNPENLLPVDRADFGGKFHKLQQTMMLNNDEIDQAKLNEIRHKCGEYIFMLTQQLIERLPANLDQISNIRYLSPHLVLSQSARPTFQQLPLHFADLSVDLDVLENQWLQIGTLSLPDICHHPDRNSDAKAMDAAHFWTCALKCTNAGGNTPFKELAEFAIKVLTLPISNADVERVFSVLALVKTKQRNRLQLETLESLLRLRCHLKVDGRCCKSFEPTADLMARFTSQMYASHHDDDFSFSSLPDEDLEKEDYEMFTLFDPDSTSDCSSV